MQKGNKRLVSYLIKFVLSLILIFISADCTSTKLVSQQTDYAKNIEKINYLGSKYSSEIYLSDKSIFYCSYLNIANDSLSFTDDADSVHQVSMNHIEKIRVKDNISSLFSAFWIGLGSGLLATLTASQLLDCGTCHPNIGPLYIGAAAVPIGFMSGYIFTGEKEYIFNNSK